METARSHTLLCHDGCLLEIHLRLFLGIPVQQPYKSSAIYGDKNMPKIIIYSCYQNTSQIINYSRRRIGSGNSSPIVATKTRPKSSYIADDKTY